VPVAVPVTTRGLPSARPGADCTVHLHPGDAADPPLALPSRDAMGTHPGRRTGSVLPSFTGGETEATERAVLVPARTVKAEPGLPRRLISEAA
jgi:hypothetical protein